MLHLLADANIPFAAKAFGRYGSVQTMPGQAITHAAISEADVLLVRSVTPVTAELLTGTPVRFVGTATAGTDHVDVEGLKEAGIAFADAPGSNAESVAEYVLAALLALAAEQGKGMEGRTLGVVGCGHVGAQVAWRAEGLGLRVLRNDPPLAEDARARGEAHAFVGFDVILAESDIVTVHTPLTRRGESAYPTYHLFGLAELAALRPGAWLFNAARGAVVDSVALAEALSTQHLGAAVLDVWEGEPVPDLDLVRGVALATPHIAGYSFDGKVAGTKMLEEALRAWLTQEGHVLPEPWDEAAALAPSPEEPLVISVSDVRDELHPSTKAAWLDALARQAYDLWADDARFRAAVAGTTPEERATAFQHLRKTYPRRRAWRRFTVQGDVPASLQAAVADGLGMHLARGASGRQWP